jgi:hypothetical protein
MQTVFTIRIACAPADADEVRNVAHRAVDSINEALYDPERTVAEVTLTNTGVTYVD